jgi:hypothetical protein
MNSQPNIRIATVLGRVRRKGVRLWSENGQLRYQAPRGALTPEEIEALRQAKGHIVSLLENAARIQKVSPSNGPDVHRHIRPHTGRAPLSFSQLAYWHIFRLDQRPGIRQITSALRLQGRLNLTALESSLTEVIRRHDALRTRIVLQDGVPGQEVDDPQPLELKVGDLTSLSQPDRETEVVRIIQDLILEPLDLSAGPLLGVKLLRSSDREHVLILAMEHIISDAFSLGLLLRDTFTAYTQVVRGIDFSLPGIPVQFRDYSVWQWETNPAWVARHGAWWKKRLENAGRVKFPLDEVLQNTAASEQPRRGWGTISVEIDRDLKAQLVEWCRQHQTTLVMGVFTAYVALVLRWCNVTECVFQYQTDGRVDPKIQNAIGYFAAELYLRIHLLPTDSFLDLLKRVTAVYCESHDHADFSYLGSQSPRPEFAKNTTFNWVPASHKIDLSALDETEDALTATPIPFEHPMLKGLERDNEPVILLYDTDGGILGGVYFPLERFSPETMAVFRNALLDFIREMLRNPRRRPNDLVPSHSRGASSHVAFPEIAVSSG